MATARSSPTPTARRSAYDYDGLDRQTTIREPGGAAVVSVSYDVQGRRSGTGRVGASSSYGYDDPGRLRELKDDQVGTASDLTSTFSYNAASQLIGNLRDNNAYVYGGEVAVTRQYAVNGLNQYVTAGPAVFGYDDNGNLTSDGSTTFNYDRENRLISASGSKTAALRYDPMGRLYETVGTVNGSTVTTRFLYDGDELVAEYDSAGNMQKRYVHGPSDDDPLLWYEGASLATRRQIFTDHQGSVVSIADGSGSNIAINTYDEWGVPGANTGRFQYTGQAWIAELGMYYYKARFYSPTLGRFMQTDPIGYKDQINLYAYVWDDPGNKRDPTGLSCTSNDKGVYACQIDKVAYKDSAGKTQIRAATGDDHKAYASTERSLTRAANAAAKAGDHSFSVSVKSKGGDYSFRVTGTEVAKNIAGAQVLVDPSREGIMESPIGGINVMSSGLNPQTGDPELTRIYEFLHEGIHNTRSEAQVIQGLPLGNEPFKTGHQGAYNGVAAQIYDDGGRP